MPLTTSHVTGPSDPPVRDITLGGLLGQAAENVPDRIALIEGVADASSRREWTYAELNAESVRTARALMSRFEKGDRVAVWAHNIPEWVMLELGCAMAGIVLVTVNPAYQRHEVAYVLQQSRAVGLFVVPGFRGNPMLSVAQELQPECPELREIVNFDEWESFLSEGDGIEGDLPAVVPSDPMMIQYTSGTTGFPKGAYLNHRGLANNATHTMERMQISEGCVFITTMPLFHTGGSVLCVLGSLAKQATQVLVDAFEPGLVLELFDTYRGSAMFGVPTMLVAMVEHPNFATTELSQLQGICSGGSLVPEALVRKFETDLGAPFTIVFGQTESSPVSSMTRPSDSIEDKSGTIGPPMPGVEVKIVDPETGETVPIGTIGEYCARGYLVMDGYFEMDEQTSETIDADGWLHTGDLAAMDERGYCTVEGRLKDMIIRGGENIYPRELEELLFAHGSVGEVAVVGLPDDKWGETVGAFIRPAPGCTVDKNELFAYLRENLSPQKTPRQWFEVEEFPLTGSGKIQKFRLREQWQAGEWTEL
jgi:acyl-CoA synthetase (AMP-forming)/AMP-acid ligase II